MHSLQILRKALLWCKFFGIAMQDIPVHRVIHWHAEDSQAAEIKQTQQIIYTLRSSKFQQIHHRSIQFSFHPRGFMLLLLLLMLQLYMAQALATAVGKLFALYASAYIWTQEFYDQTFAYADQMSVCFVCSLWPTSSISSMKHYEKVCSQLISLVYWRIVTLIIQHAPFVRYHFFCSKFESISYSAFLFNGIKKILIACQHKYCRPFNRLEQQETISTDPSSLLCSDCYLHSLISIFLSLFFVSISSNSVRRRYDYSVKLSEHNHSSPRT